MHPALSVVIATSLGWSAADLSAAAPADLLVEALATEIRVRLGNPPATPAPCAAPVPGLPAASAPVLDAPAAAPVFTTDRRDDVRYDWRLPVFRTKP